MIKQIMQKKFKPKKLLILYTSSTIIIVFIVGLILLFNKNIKTQNYADIDNVAQIQIEEDPKPWDWWNQEYSYYRQINISNKNPSSNLQRNTWTTLTLNHKEMVENKKSRPDGNDLKMYYKTQKAYHEVPLQITNQNTEQTQIQFLLLGDILPKTSDDNYYLYYGNLLAEDTPSYSSQQEENSGIDITLKEETKPKISGSTDRQWIIQDLEAEYGADLETLIYSLEIEDNVPKNKIKNPTYQVLSTKTEMQGEMIKKEDGKYEVKINAQNLEPGKYQIQSFYSAEDQDFYSQRSAFFVSKPLYIALTVDWEGYDVPNNELDTINQFSLDHDNLLLTHFFNPRIYVTQDISIERTVYLNEWAKIRKDYGDEFGLHIHMHNDLLWAAGVEAKIDQGTKAFYSPDYIDDGYDTPATSYSYEETKKVVEWSRNQLDIMGLGQAKSFRFGAWFANIENLKAINDAGFLIDSSGRKKFNINDFTSEWNLNTTTRPYQISISDQNKTDPENHLNLWEFPSLLLQKNNNQTLYFDQALADNFQYFPLDQSQVLTYLTHAYSFTNDLEYLQNMISNVKQYSAENDTGPVIITTLEKAYEKITKTEDL